MAFSEDGPNNAAGITRTATDTFQLTNPGIYLVQFDVYATDPCPLILTLNQEEIPYTLATSLTGQISGMSLVTVDSENAVLTVRNPTDNTTQLTIEAQTGSAGPVSHLIIVRLCA